MSQEFIEKDCLVCEEAVRRAYFTLRKNNVPYESAFHAANRVFRYHHPDVDFSSSINETKVILKFDLSDSKEDLSDSKENGKE